MLVVQGSHLVKVAFQQRRRMESSVSVLSDMVETGSGISGQ